MNDIKFYWAKGSESIGISAEVSSPPFYVIGHRGQVYEISLSTGKLKTKPISSFDNACYI